MSSSVIIIETSDIGAGYTAGAVTDLGFEPVFICHLGNYQADTLKQIKEFKHIDMDTSSARSIVNAIRTHVENGLIAKPSAAITFLDSRLEVAIEVAELLGVVGIDLSVKDLKDKGFAWSKCPETMPPSLLISRNQISLDKISLFLQQNSRVIAKPCKAAGGLGFKVFDQGVTAKDIMAHMDRVQIPDFLSPDSWILQSYIQGEIVSLEGYIRQGEFFPLGFTGRKKVGNTETVCIFPDHSSLPSEGQKIARDFCEKLLRVTGVNNAYFHIELIVDSSGPYIMDANIGRLGGGGIGELLAFSYGRHPVEIFKHVLEVTLKLPESDIYLSQSPRTAISISYGAERSGYLHQISNMDGLRGFHTQILDQGQMVPAMGGDNWSWIGIATGWKEQIYDDLTKVKLLIDAEELNPCF